MDDENNELEHLGGTDTLVQPTTRTKTPSFYRVIILNDDFTPRDFVVHILQKYFGKDETEATQLMMQVHTKGSGVAGVFPFEIAETKCYQVNSYSKQNHYPLKTIVERV